MARRGRIDVGRVAAAAIEAAVHGDEPRPQPRRFSGVKAVAVGAALAAAARVAVSKTPSIPRLPDLSDLTGGLRDRLVDNGWLDDEENDEPEAEAEDEAFDDPEDEEDDEEEPDEDEEPEEDEEPDEDEAAEAEGEPEATEEDEDDAEEEDADEDDAGAPGIELGDTPDVMRALSDHPANRPPEPPTENGSNARRSKSGRR